MRRLLGFGFGLLLACSASPRARLDGALGVDAPTRDATADVIDDAGHTLDGGDDAGRPDGATVTLESYCERASLAWCRWLDRCGAGCTSGVDAPGWCETAMAAVAAGRPNDRP